MICHAHLAAWLRLLRRPEAFCTQGDVFELRRRVCMQRWKTRGATHSTHSSLSGELLALQQHDESISHLANLTIMASASTRLRLRRIAAAAPMQWRWQAFHVSRSTTVQRPLLAWSRPILESRSLSSSSSKPDKDSHLHADPNSKKADIRSVSAGLPDWIEHWSRDNFRKVGYGLGAASLLSVPVGYPLLSAALATTTAAYWTIGLNDIGQTKQTIRRNFPVLGNMRYLLESIRPEIRQYFIEADDEQSPFSRSHRTIVYMRAKGIESTQPFGTRRNVNAVGYEWAQHSLYPTKIGEQRILVGGNNPHTTQPYSASMLNISAMSYGALSDRAILALSAGAKLGNFYHNTGEGAISKFHREGGADLVWNIGTAYFGCGTFDDNGARVFDPTLFVDNSKYAKMIEIKLSQGAKPAHGGMLPKEKKSLPKLQRREIFPTRLSMTATLLHGTRHSTMSRSCVISSFSLESYQEASPLVSSCAWAIQRSLPLWSELSSSTRSPVDFLISLRLMVVRVERALLRRNLVIASALRSMRVYRSPTPAWLVLD